MTRKPLDTALFLICASLYFTHSGLLAQNIPPIGKKDGLEICNWNLEWFGKTAQGYGPGDDVLQQKQVLNAIQAADIDLWALCEVANPVAFDSMMQKLPAYDFVMSTYMPEQKTALIFKKDMFRVVSSRLLGTANKDSFSTSRFPFEITLLPLQEMGMDTLFVILLHLKSNTGSEAEKMSAYNSRKRSSEWLKMYLSASHKNHFCAVLGDWNDDLDESIYKALPSPFTDLLQTGFPFYFPTRKLTLSGQSSTTSYNNIIDHQLVSSKLSKLYHADSTFIFRLDKYIPDYAQTTSDHYPVYSRFGKTSSSTHAGGIQNFRIWPCPADRLVYIDGLNSCPEVSISSADGKNILYIKPQGNEIDISGLAPGLYFLSFIEDGSFIHLPLIIEH